MIASCAGHQNKPLQTLQMALQLNVPVGYCRVPAFRILVEHETSPRSLIVGLGSVGDWAGRRLGGGSASCHYIVFLKARLHGLAKARGGEPPLGSYVVFFFFGSILP